MPLAGGLVGYASYDVVRFFETPAGDRARRRPRRPLLHYVAPRSLLVFDHLTRGIALLHDGSEAERQALRRKSSARCAAACPGNATAGGYRAAGRAISRPRRITSPACGARRSTSPPATSISSCCRSRFEGRHELDPFEVYRALRSINPSPYMYYCELGDVTVVGSSPEALVKPERRQARSCGRSPARARAPTIADDRSRARAGAARRPEGERRARDARRPRAQRSRPRRARPAACASSRTAPSSATAT